MDYAVFKLDNPDYRALVLFRALVSPFRFLEDLACVLSEESLIGHVIFDTFLKSGNSPERFISIYFDGRLFDNSSAHFIDINKKSEIRKITSDYLMHNPDEYLDSLLSSQQKDLINKGVSI